MPRLKLSYGDFRTAVRRAGLTSLAYSDVRWQIADGSTHQLVNCWNTRMGFTFMVDGGKKGTSRVGTVADAIELAGPPSKPQAPVKPAVPVTPPWESERVGLIRWLWRLIW